MRNIHKPIRKDVTSYFYDVTGVIFCLYGAVAVILVQVAIQIWPHKIKRNDWKSKPVKGGPAEMT